ncbi:MAG: LexA family transcriptional regulator [Deltaproteobacteria bacterium]|nr:LexA family transcriptional regulator [Deltaproteobacteria bacterium]
MAKKMFSLEIFLQQVQKLMEEKGIKDQKNFNEMVGVQRAITRWKSGESRPSVDSLMMIKKLFGKSIDSLLTGEESPPFQPAQPIITVLGEYPEVPKGLRPEQYSAVPLVEGNIAAGYTGAIPGDYVSDMVWVYNQELGHRLGHNLRAVRLGKDADSMEPTIHPGSIVIIDPTETQITPKAIFAVRLDREGGCAIKRVQQTDEHWVLVSDNPEYDPIAIEKTRIPNIIIGRVIWSWTSWMRES